MANVFTLDNSNVHYFRSRNLALPQDSHSLRRSTRDLWTVVSSTTKSTSLQLRKNYTRRVFSFSYNRTIQLHVSCFLNPARKACMSRVTGYRVQDRILILAEVGFISSPPRPDTLLHNELKAKAIPLHAAKALGGESKYSSYSFSTSAVDGGEWSASHPSRVLVPRKGPPVPIVQEAGWAPEPVWTQRLDKKSFCPCRRSNLDRSVV
jgi:hypothetical protein